VRRRRERNRGDRTIGQACWQLKDAHENLPYDVTVDTSKHMLEE